jgi:Fungal specific transcription factor domain
MTKLASALVYKIDPTTDIRYQLVWNFGGYLADVPRRLGTNPALDAASDALVAAHTDFCSSGRPGSECELLAKHSHALSVLRDALDDPVKAHSSETLCAIMLLMIVQVCKKPCLLVFQCLSKLCHRYWRTLPKNLQLAIRKVLPKF